MTYAALEDMTTLWRPMTSAEQARASSLLEVVSASLNMEAQKVGKDLPALHAQPHHRPEGQEEQGGKILISGAPCRR